MDIPQKNEKVISIRSREKYLYRVGKILDHIHRTSQINNVWESLRKDILVLLDAEDFIVYFASEDLRTLTTNNKAETYAIDNKTIAGHVATSKRPLLIQNTYNSKALTTIHPELQFKQEQDAKVAIVQVLAVPILWGRSLIGVLQVNNKIHGDRFTEEDRETAYKITGNFAIAFHNSVSKQKELLRKFELLLKNNIITKENVTEALERAKEKNVSVEDILISDYGVKKSNIEDAITSYYNIPLFIFKPELEVPHELLSFFQPRYLRENLWVPFKDENGKVFIAIDNPKAIHKLDDIKKKVNFKSYSLFVATPEDILKTIDYFWGPEKNKNQPKETLSNFEKILEDLDSPETSEVKQKIDIDDSDNAVIRIVDQMIRDAHKNGASDIYIEPSADALNIRVRIDGICYEYNKVPMSISRSIISRIKIMADLDIANRLTPQDGKIVFKNFGNLDIELRVAILPIINREEAAVIRILAAKEPIPIDNIGMRAKSLEKFKELIQSPYGLLLVVGPTGSGKTTTLHSGLSLVNTSRKKIWTAEDPVEITQKGLSQVQINNKAGYTFAKAMRSFLRAAPDIIMIGEMRDHETASIAVEASLTGHLVMSTLHTNSAPETITRLIDIGIDPFNFGDALIGILAQRLVRTLCEKCKQEVQIKKDVLDALVYEYNQDNDEGDDTWQAPEDALLYSAKGCSQCIGGLKGRVGIHELLVNSREITSLIHQKATVEKIRKTAIRSGMATLKQDGIRKVLQGLTDMYQVRSACLK